MNWSSSICLNVYGFKEELAYLDVAFKVLKWKAFTKAKKDNPIAGKLI